MRFIELYEYVLEDMDMDKQDTGFEPWYDAVYIDSETGKIMDYNELIALGINNDDEDNDEDEENVVDENNCIVETIKKKKVIRKGKILRKYYTTKPGYRIKIKDGRPKEVKMSPSELRRRSKAQKKASRKRKPKASRAVTKRKRSLKKRFF